MSYPVMSPYFSESCINITVRMSNHKSTKFDTFDKSSCNDKFAKKINRLCSIFTSTVDLIIECIRKNTSLHPNFLQRKQKRMNLQTRSICDGMEGSIKNCFAPVNDNALDMLC